MRIPQRGWTRFRSLLRRPAVKREIDEELDFHLERLKADNLAAGLPPEAAAREARKRFGNVQSLHEECREVRGASLGETAGQDLRFGLRMLWKNPGFATVSALALGLGIGANAAMFGLGMSGAFVVLRGLDALIPAGSPLRDPVTLPCVPRSGWVMTLTATVLVLGLTLLACCLPAGRAANVNPRTALRYE